MLTIIMPFSSYRIKMLRSILSMSMPKLVNKTTSLWFHNLLGCFKPYMLCGSWAIGFFLINVKNSILSGDFMRLIVHCLSAGFSFIIWEKVLLMCILFIFKKPYTINLALYWTIILSEWYLTLKIYLDLTLFFLNKNW